MKSDIIGRLLMLVIVMLPCAPVAAATQHLVRPGDNWSLLIDRVQPGDEIILMPGHHRPAYFERLEGTAQNRITIRGLDPDHPSIIDADRYGMRLRSPQYVTVRDLTISGAGVAGMWITSAPPPQIGADGLPVYDTSELVRPHAANLVIKNVLIERTGPHGRRHAIRLMGIEGVRIEQSRFEGWGGSAVELIGCHDVTIEACTFRGRADHGQISAIQIRAGSERVRILNNTIIDAGDTAIAIGGSSMDEEYCPALPDDPAPRSHYEAQRIQVRHCVIKGGESAFSFTNCNLVIVRSNTILNPRRCAYVLQDRERAFLGETQRTNFGSNLIVWDTGPLDALALAPEDASARGLIVEVNLWWAPVEEEEWARLGTPVGEIQWPQIQDVDPRLDETYRPREQRAHLFGAVLP